MSIRLLAALPLLLALAGCAGGADDPETAPSPTETTATAQPSPAPEPPPAPDRDACYRMPYVEAVSPTTTAEPVPCRRTHTAQTFHVGTLDTVVGGHLLAVDSKRVQRQVAARCPDLLAGFVGGSEEQRRLSMLRPLWFTPSVDDSDAGARWFRCDLVALAGNEELLPVTGSLAGVLDTEAGRLRFGVCGTAEPGTPDFRRVVCARPHSWRAIRTVPLEGEGYPGEARARAAGEEPCRAAAEAVADDPLDYQWGYEWPSVEQWRAGHAWGLCWVPD